MKKILAILFMVFVVMLIAGCKKAAETDVSEEIKEPATTTEANSQSISETEDISAITDDAGEEELDSIDSAIDNW